MSDKSPEEAVIEQAVALDRLFNAPEWPQVVKIEEDYLSDLETQMVRLRPVFGSLEAYAQEHLILKGKRDALIELWAKRSTILDDLKTRLREEEADKQEDKNA